MIRVKRCLLAGCLCWVGMAQLLATPPSSTIPNFLPASTVIYVEGVDVQTLLDLPLVSGIKAAPAFRELWRSPEVMKARGALTLAEVALGEPVVEAVARATQGGWVLAVDAQTKGVALLAESQDSESCQQIYQRLENLAADDAQRNQRSFEKTSYRDIVAYQFNGSIVAALDKWLVITNQGDFGKLMADNWASGQTEAAQGSLSTLASFTQARQQRLQQAVSEGQAALVWAWVDIQQLRQRGIAKKLFMPPDDNFAAELLMGGVLSVLRQTSSLTADLWASPDGLQLSVSAATPKIGLSKQHEYFFGPEASGRAPQPVSVAGPHATLTAYRDLAQLWQRSGDLFGQTVNDQLAQADATLTTLFSGRQFGEEILGAIEPGVQIVVAEQTVPAGEAPTPAVKLPAFGLVAQLKDGAQMRPELKRIFMSLLGFLNIVGAMNQQPQLDVELLQSDQLQMVTSSYVLDRDRPKDWITPIQFNFTPTLAMQGNQVVLASTRGLAEEVAAQWNGDNRQHATTDSNTRLHVDGQLVTTALAANRQQLISQNMIEKGQTQAEATDEFDMLLKLLKLVHSFDLQLDTQPQTTLRLDLRLAR